MGEKLQLRFLYTFALFSVLLLSLSASMAYAQIAITDSDRFAVSFSQTRTVIEKESVILSISDLSEIMGQGYDLSFEPWSETSGEGEHLFVDDMPGSTALRGLKPIESDRQTFSRFDFVNQSESDFEAMSVAFDFLYFYQPDLSYSLQLFYRVNQDQWREVSGGIISTVNLQQARNSWESFSLQSTLDNMYLSTGDTIEFDWRVTNSNNTSEQLPLAIQQVEINPVQSRQEAPKQGSVMITEIMQSNPQNNIPEFIELYNPTEEPISLKGVEMVTSTGRVVIQDEISIRPYEFFTLSNQELNPLSSNASSYIYSGQLLQRENRYVELRFSGKEIAKATIENAEAGVSLELDRVVNAFDGYTSLQNLNPSSVDFRDDMKASPGRSGNTFRMFTKEFNSGGWHLVSAPGLFEDRLNRQTSFQFFDLDGNDIMSDGIEVFEPFLIFKENDDEARVNTEELKQVSSQGRVLQINNHSSLLSIPSSQGLTMDALVNELDQMISPVMLTWDVPTQSFKILMGRETEIKPWTPVIVNREVAVPLQTLEENRSSTGFDLERYIQFRYLEEGSNRSERVVDEGIVGFIDSQRLRTNKRFDLPKFYPFMDRDETDMELSLFHISNSLSNSSANSFTHLPFELDQEYKLDLGITTNKSSVQGILEWSQMEDIPEDWIITLEDRVTGITVDMREETRYRFRQNSTRDFDQEQFAGKPFSEVNPIGEERFVVTMKPYMSAMESAGNDTQPGSIELRQNYPNPFNPTTNIVYYLPENNYVRVGIYNVVGQQVATLVDDNMNAGEHTVSWNASEMPSGIYIVQLETGNRIFTRKITLIK